MFAACKRDEPRLMRLATDSNPTPGSFRRLPRSPQTQRPKQMHPVTPILSPPLSLNPTALAWRAEIGHGLLAQMAGRLVTLLSIAFVARGPSQRGLCQVAVSDPFCANAYRPVLGLKALGTGVGSAFARGSKLFQLSCNFSPVSCLELELRPCCIAI